MMLRVLLGFLALSLAAPAADRRWNIQYQYRQIDSTLAIDDLAFPSATRGIACGATTDRHNNEHPIVLVTSDAGAHWTEEPVKEACVSLFFLDDSVGWMVTDKGIWKTAESGRNWKKLNKAPAGLLRLWFLDAARGFAVGLEKRVFQTTDGGETWTLVPISKEVQGDAEFTTFGQIAFSGKNGIISGWNIPPRRGGPDWMEPEKAKTRRQVPNLSVLLQTIDGGVTWEKSETSLFGQITRVSMTPQGTALGLVEFKDEFDYPSEVFRINLHTGQSDRTFREKDRAITDVRLFAGSNRGFLAGYEATGTLYHSPIPGKLKVLTTDDLENWREMPVDYRAVAHRAMIAGPDEDHLWIATDTGIILNLVTE
jgi:photosystem II stability/assembly factor-like uncharacterized protein